MAVYRAEYAQVVHRFFTLAYISCEKFVRPMPTSLVHPEMVYPGKKYEVYCLKAAEPGTEIQYELVSDFKMDGLQPRIDLRPGMEVRKYPEDEVDADPRFNKYPPHEEFVEGPDWVPGQIPPQIRSPEYGGNSSDTSSDTQASRIKESLHAKLLARKEQEKWYKKIVENPVLYIEERTNQILPEEHQPEVQSMRFFGAGAERAAIDILAIIDWAEEYVAISNHPVPDIPSFLRRPFVMGKAVIHPIPEDPTESLLKEKCIRTKAQKAWTYLCALLQF